MMSSLNFNPGVGGNEEIRKITGSSVFFSFRKRGVVVKYEIYWGMPTNPKTWELSG